MKISDFSRKYGVPVDTIRYYIDSSLLTPQKIHNRYVFDEVTEEQMEQILELKELQFTISEISKILSIERINQIMSKRKRDYFHKFFTEKYNDLIQEKTKIEEAINIIKNKLSDLNKIELKNETKIGFPIKNINLISCPKCNSNLSLNADKIENNQIFSGELNCQCGFEVEIDDGILIFEGADKSSKHEDLEKEIEDFYNKDSTPRFTSAFYKGLTWIRKELLENMSEDKIILELSAATGFLPFYKRDNDKNNIYIINQQHLAFTKYLKNNLNDQTETLDNIIFTVGNMNSLPIKKNIIDYVVDIFATSNALAGKDHIPADVVKKYMSENSLFISLDVYFDEWAKSLKKFDVEERKFFTKPSKDNLYKEAGFENHKSTIIDTLVETGSHATVHLTGEKFYIYTHIKKRKKEL
ncbi:MAG: MerR family transcriptional regulator [Thermotogota bacterium]